MHGLMPVWLQDTLAGHLVRRLALVLLVLMGLQIGLFGLFFFLQTRDRYDLQGRADVALGSLLMSRIMDGAVDSNAVAVQDFWDDHYEEIPGTDPKKFNTLYDSFLDNAIVRLEDQFLENPDVAFAILSDRHGYVPSHHTRYSPPMTGDPNKDRGNLTKQFLRDKRLIAAAGQATESRLVTQDELTGEPLLVYSQPVTVKGRHWGAFHVGLKLNRLYQTAFGIGGILALFLGVSSLIFLGLIALVTRRMTQPLARLEQAASMLGAGQLNVELAAEEGSDQTEIGRIEKAFARMIVQMRQTLRQVRVAADTVASGTEQISSSSEQMALTSRSQAESASSAAETIERMAGSIQLVAGNMGSVTQSVDETSSSISEMAASIQQVAGNADTLAQAAVRTAGDVEGLIKQLTQVTGHVEHANRVSEASAQAATEGQEAVKQTIEGMGEINRTMSEVVTVIERLGQSSAQIGNIVEVIDDIAEQTNLLALNAAIEAARAGEHGRGFAVVADEVRKLAERSGKATREIAELIKGIQRETTQAIDTTQQGDQVIRQGTRLAEAAGDALHSIVSSVEQVGGLLSEVAQATDHQAEAARHIEESARTMTDLSDQVKRATREQAQAGEQIMRAIGTMNQLTHEVSRSTDEQGHGSRRMVEMVETISRASQENVVAVQIIARSTRELQVQTHGLQQAVGYFQDSEDLRASEAPTASRTLMKTLG